HKLTIILSLGMVIFGLMGLAKLNAESFPTVNFAMAQITTRYEGATAKDVETKITKPIEDKIREVSGLKDVKSVSKSGLSKIMVRVDMDNEDEDEVLDELQKAVKEVNNLPTDLRDDPAYMEINSEEFPAVELAVIGDNVNRARELMVDALKEELEDSKRVKNVRLVGFRKRQFYIRVDENKMAQYHIGIEEVLAKVKSRNVDIPGGNLDNKGYRQLIRVEGKIRDAADLEQLVVRSNFTGKKILLKDIADVFDGAEDAKTLASFNGKKATFLIVNKKGGSDTIALVKEVNIILARFQKQYEGQFEIKIYNNEGEKVKKKLDILSSNAISGLVLVVLFLFIFLPGKIGLMASMSLPLAVMATVGFMPIFGMNLDAITILALVIALGMLVDNSVVISENFARLRSEHNMDANEAAFTSVKQLWLPITTTGFTTIAAFLPMLVTKGIMGQFIKYIPIVVSISLLISLVESFFFLPMRLRFAAGKDKKKGEQTKKDWFHRFIEKFENFMTKLVKHRYLVAVGFGVTIFGALLLMTMGNKFMLFPPEQTEIYVGRIEMPRGTSLVETEREMMRISNEMEASIGNWQRAIVVRAGTSTMGPTDPKGATGENHGLFVIYASDFAKYNVFYTDFLDKVRLSKSEVANDLTFEAMANGPPVGEPINGTFRSNNAESLALMVSKIQKKLAAIPGVRDLKIDDILGEEEIKVKIDYAKADQLGLSVNSIGSAIRTALSGTMISKVSLDNKEIDLNVRYQDKNRVSDKNIDNIKTMDRLGNLVPVSTVARLAKTDGSHEIKRFDFKRSKTLTGTIDESKITSFEANQKLEQFYNELLAEHQDVSLVFGGEGESTKESMQSLGEALIIALIGIFALLVFLFKSYLRPIIIMSTIPLGLVGFSIAFFFHNKPISFLAMIGVIGLAGIIVNSGIVLISFIDQMREEGKLELHEILIKASGLRLRAVLVTSLTTVSGLIPTAYGIGGSDSMLVPMTMAMAWGLTSGTILTLIWVPCAYAILEDWIAFIGRINFFKSKEDTSITSILKESV
ncbi:MAG: efflux RND transporter permease subunit, partial [Halobacteriovoraceae bacterium]|nr:efflux RND transporter permease subunit [Halobacteriovoraceae bacterium]